jgi:riboflavin kinase/FMN adenylyltransferase
VGNFDGVHRGHQAILAAARRLAGSSGHVTAVTFWPHPLTVLAPDRAPALLCDLDERKRLLRQYGADDVHVVDFTAELAGLSPNQFIQRILRPIHPQAVVVGSNFHFGVGASADGERMRALAEGLFDVTVLPLLSDGGTVSSSRIRQALVDGEPARAAKMLGRWFRYIGVVVTGDRRGRTLGFPTANIEVPALRACPADGVYAGFLVSDTQRWAAAISVGDNPTFDGADRRVEAYAIDQVGLQLYGQRMGVDFVAKVREQRRFDSREDLIEQMTADVRTVSALVADTEPDL